MSEPARPTALTWGDYVSYRARAEAAERTVAEQTTEIEYLGKRAAAAEESVAKLEGERDEYAAHTAEHHTARLRAESITAELEAKLVREILQRQAAERARDQHAEALKGVSNAYGCFAGCPAGGIGAISPTDFRASKHTPACRAAREALSVSVPPQDTNG